MTLLLDAEARLFAAVTVKPVARARWSMPVAPATWAGASAPRRTLDDLLSDTWDGLLAPAARAGCPVCGGELVRRSAAAGGPLGGCCRDCGSELT